MRRLSEELKPRVLTLKSLTPLCTRSTPGVSFSAIGTWPVMVLFSSSLGSTTEMAAGASTIRSGAREAPCTTRSLRIAGAGSSAASSVAVPPGSTVTGMLDRPVPQPAEHDDLRTRGHVAQRVAAVAAGHRGLAGAPDRDRDAGERAAAFGAGHGAGDGPGSLCCRRWLG